MSLCIIAGWFCFLATADFWTSLRAAFGAFALSLSHDKHTDNRHL